MNLVLDLDLLVSYSYVVLVATFLRQDVALYTTTLEEEALINNRRNLNFNPYF